MDTVSGPDRHPEETLTEMVRQHQTALLRLCYAYLHDRTMAEDAVQETFLKAFQGLSQFRGEAETKTWLSRIAVNTCRDARRSAWFRRVNRAVTPEMLPERASECARQDDEITAAVMNLPIRLRECVLLYYFQEMNTVEIASALGVSQQAVSGRLKRAKEKLRREMERSGRDG